MWAYDPVTDRFHRLNALASLIAELCDGQHRSADIHRLVAPLLPGAEAGAVSRCLEQGREAGLFQERARNPETAAGEERDPVILARRLKREGRVEAAYVCQVQVAACHPEEPDSWWRLGELARILGRRAEARAAYERGLQLSPENGEIRHLLLALSDQPPPPRAAETAIESLYARFAPFYDSNMLDELDYQAPRRVAELVAEMDGGRTGLAALDLGCGSGLAGLALGARYAHLTGVDLSRPMLELARGRNLYDTLEVAEISAWLREATSSFDLIVACDSLIYFGDLRPVLLPAALRLNPGGLLVFTLEQGTDFPFRLHDNGRYTHEPGYVLQIADATGLRLLHLEAVYLRMEYGQAVTGLLVALARPGRSANGETGRD